MTDIKTNLRDGAYVALGAAALGVQHLSKKRDSVRAHIDQVSARFEPVIRDVSPRIKDAGDRVGQSLAPLANLSGRISPVAENVYGTVSSHFIPAANNVAERVSTNLGPVASSVARQVKVCSEQAITSTKKIADEAKRRVS